MPGSLIPKSKLLVTTLNSCKAGRYRCGVRGLRQWIFLRRRAMGVCVSGELGKQVMNACLSELSYTGYSASATECLPGPFRVQDSVTFSLGDKGTKIKWKGVDEWVGSTLRCPPEVLVRSGWVTEFRFTGGICLLYLVHRSFLSF